MSDDADVEELRKRHQKGSRVTGAAAETEEAEDEVSSLEEAMVAAFEEIEAGETAKSLSLRDGQLASLIHGLEAEPDELEAVGIALQEALDREIDSEAVDRSEVLRLAVRVGLREAAPEVVETARNAQARHLTSQF
jgi:hypothetical protein